MRPRHTARKRSRRRGWRWQTKAAVGAAAVIFLLIVWAIIARELAPTSNVSASRFDAIIVLGMPADSDGNPTPAMLANVSEGVREYKRGVATHMILTGAAVRNRFVEAQVMARIAEAQGIPASAIFTEPQARDTIENACYAERILNAHEWRSAEVVTNPAHAPRAGMIFNATPLKWSMHVAPPLEPPSAAHEIAAQAVEVLKTARYLTWAQWADRCEP